jgi:hypothetical protein
MTAGLKPETGLRDPLGIARVICDLTCELAELGMRPEARDDFGALAALKLELRQTPVAPFFDPQINQFGGQRAFWMRLSDKTGMTVGLQAFRIDIIETSLADWAASYTIGLYMRRQEVLVPSHASPPRGSISERITGRLAYHGELWIDRSVRNRRVVDAFGRLGLMLSLVKWHPDAVWALTSQAMATRGHLNRMGFTYLERGFFRWQWGSDDMDAVEWVAIAERAALEQTVDEMLTTPQQSQQA